MGFTGETPVVAGTVLVRDSIQSQNYVAGTTGWSIMSDGNAEFNSVTVRGTLEVDGTNNASITISTFVGVPQINLYPGDSGGHTVTAGSIFAQNTASTVSRLSISAPNIDGATRGVIRVIADGSANGAVTIGGTMTDSNTLLTYMPGQNGILITFDNAGGLAVITTTVTFPQAFPAGVKPVVMCNLESNAGNANGYFAKARAVSNTGFTMMVATSGTAAAWTGATAAWVAYLPS